MRFRFCAFLLLLDLAFLSGARAQDQGDGSLHVLRPSIDVEQDAAEICLEFDRTLDVSDHARIVAGIHLTMDGKAVTGLSSNVNATESALCIEALEHRRRYDLAVANLRGAKGEKLPGPYTLSFTVPDRHPTLAFAGNPNADGLPRYKDSDPVLRAINIARARIELYRLTDPAADADAWRQRLQASLAPSESLTFARSKGKLVWRGEMVLDNGDDESSANRTIEETVPLRAAAGALAPGLYFIAASAPASAAKAKSKAAEDALEPLAAQWFLRSDLRLRALPSRDGFYAETEDASGTVAVKDVHLVVSDRNGQALAEGQSDTNGIAFLPIAADKRAGADMLAGTTSAGDIDFADLAAAPDERFAPPNLAPSLATDRPFYRPSTMVNVALGLRDIHDAAIAVTGSTLILQRPDGGFYQSVNVPDSEAGVSYVSFPAPAVEGKWSIVWQQSDGRKLIEAPLRVTSNRDAPVLAIAADRMALGKDGEINLALKSLTSDGRPAPYVAGRVLLRWRAPDTLAGWNDYTFGVGGGGDENTTPVSSFVTDSAGMASLHLILKTPDENPSLHTAEISVEADPVSGAAAPDLLMLPLQSGRAVIGLKPLALNGKFAENSLARFDAVALDGDGKRQGVEGLSYQVYEEGRHFDWYQADGRWDYKPEQQRRRIGGGVLAIKGGGTIISWPVTAGSYTLEIGDASGAILVRAHAEAGWGLSKLEPTAPPDLVLKSNMPSVRPGAPFKIAFTLDKPAMIDATVTDDRIRKLVHEVMPAGDNAIEFTPDEDWGARIGIRIEARNGPVISVGTIALPVAHNRKELALNATLPDAALAGQELALPLAVANISSPQPTFVSAVTIPEPEAGTARDGISDGTVLKGIAVDRDGKAVLHMTAPVFSGVLRLKITAANQDQKGFKELAIPVQPLFAADLSLPPVLHVNDALPVTLGLENNGPTTGTFHYAVNASPGLGVSGAARDSVTLAPGKTKSIALTLRALRGGEQEIRLEISGPRNFHDDRGWTVAVVNPAQDFNDASVQIIAPQESFTLPSPGKARGGESRFLFISPRPLLDLPELLQTLIETEPFTTGEITAWLEATRLWRDVIAEAGLRPERALEDMREQILFRLMRRQKADGAFPDLPDGDENVASTGEALVALAHADRPITRPAADRAAGWLHEKMQNSWFDEKERPERAAAFAALAVADRLDVATLRYFAETSADKKLPPLAAAQLAAALVKSGDPDKAKLWLKAERDAQDPKEPASLAVLATLADIALIDPRDLVPDLEKRADELIKHRAHDPLALADLLHLLFALDDRAGAWRVNVDNQDKNQKGVLVMAWPEKDAPLVLRNPTDGQLFVLESMMTPSAATNAGIRRRLFRLDGTETAGAALEPGGIYMLSLEGTAPSAGNDVSESLFVHDAPGSGLSAVSCALDGNAGTTGSWAWLENLAPTPAPSCEPTRTGTDTILAAPSAGPWRVAYLVKAERAGSFMPAPATMRAAPGQEWVTGETASAPVDIK